MNMFNHAQLWKKYFLKEYLSLKKQSEMDGTVCQNIKPPLLHTFLPQYN